jgi:hypothetical protein
MLEKLPCGCKTPGVSDLKKSSGVINTSCVPLTGFITSSVAKYRNTLSGVENCLMRFSYSIICVNQHLHSLPQ